VRTDRRPCDAAQAIKSSISGQSQTARCATVVLGRCFRRDANRWTAPRCRYGSRTWSEKWHISTSLTGFLIEHAAQEPLCPDLSLPHEANSCSDSRKRHWAVREAIKWVIVDDGPRRTPGILADYASRFGDNHRHRTIEVTGRWAGVGTPFYPVITPSTNQYDFVCKLDLDLLLRRAISRS